MECVDDSSNNQSNARFSDFPQFSCDGEDRQPCMERGNNFDNTIGAWRKDQNPLFLELCSGCGVLSATVASFGFDTMPVDHRHNKHRVHIKTFNLDLSDEHGWKTLRYVVEQCNVIAVHIAPPCGTCSRAREIRLSAD